MDLSKYIAWNEIDEDRFWRALHNNLFHVGSRSILEEPDIKPETDYDFMAEWSFEMEEFITKLGFDKKGINFSYMDDATHSVWTHPLQNVQIVLKHPAHYLNCVKMWNVFRNNPVFFREYFWKSNPDEDISQDVVRERINEFLKFVAIK